MKTDIKYLFMKCLVCVRHCSKGSASLCLNLPQPRASSCSHAGRHWGSRFQWSARADGCRPHELDSESKASFVCEPLSDWHMLSFPVIISSSVLFSFFLFWLKSYSWRNSGQLYWLSPPCSIKVFGEHFFLLHFHSNFIPCLIAKILVKCLVSWVSFAVKKKYEH